MEMQIPIYNTYTFMQVYDKLDTFLDDYNNCGIPTIVDEDNIKTLYYLLMASYGNNPIANSDIGQFKLKLFSIVFQYGPTWEKNLEIQEKLRNLSLADDSELYKGTKMIYNHSFNPSTAPSTDSLNELTTIDDQNTANTIKGKLNALAELNLLLKTNVTETFLRQFKKLFKVFVNPERPILYEEV